MILLNPTEASIHNTAQTKQQLPHFHQLRTTNGYELLDRLRLKKHLCYGFGTSKEGNEVFETA